MNKEKYMKILTLSKKIDALLAQKEEEETKLKPKVKKLKK